MTTLKRGSSGEETRTLQRELNSRGYNLKEDGQYGAATEAAVRDYQRRNGLTADGIAGAKTWSHLGYETAEKPWKRVITEVIVHCSATPEGREVSSATIDAGHKARKFSAYTDPHTGKLRYIGYHVLIHLDGSVEICRPETVSGCHASGHNKNSLGVCFIGGLDKAGNPKDTRTPEQKAALRRVVADWRERYPTIERVIGHRDTSPDLNGNGKIEPWEWLKACPCFDVSEEGL